MESNVQQQVLYAQHQSIADRKAVAGACTLGLKLTIPTLLDDMENTADLMFSGWPERLYVLSPEGQVIYQGGKGPFGFNTEEWERFLAELVGEA